MPGKPTSATGVTLNDVRNFFGMNLSQFKAEWTAGGLTDQDKKQIKGGIENGTFTY